MTGLLALNGGQEHRTGCEDIDLRLVQECGLDRAEVTVLLAATRRGRKGFKIAEAQDYWRPFGVNLRIGFTGEHVTRAAEHEHALALLANPDLVVLTGGYPWLLHNNLSGSPVLDRVMQLWRDGVPVSGSSAGAMALCQWRPQLRPPDPFRMIDAFGLVPGTAAAPHFEHFDMNRFARLVVSRYTHLSALGLPNRTALVGREGCFTVRGKAAVSIVRSTGTTTYPPGAALAL